MGVAPLIGKTTKPYFKDNKFVGVVVDIDLVRNAVNAVRAEFGKMPDGTVAKTGQFFTFGIGAAGEAEAEAMAKNLGWDPVKSVIKNADSTYSVVADITSVNEAVDILNLTEQYQIKNGGYLKPNPSGAYPGLPGQFDYMINTLDLNNRYFDVMIQTAYQFLSQSQE